MEGIKLSSSRLEVGSSFESHLEFEEDQSSELFVENFLIFEQITLESRKVGGPEGW